MCMFFFVATFFLYFIIFSFLTGLDRKLHGILQAGYRPSTAKTYSSVQSRYWKFCSLYSLQALPASELTILRFIAHLTPKVNHNSLQVYLAAVRALHVLNGFQAPPITTPRIQLALKSLSQSASDIKQAHPITFTLMSHFNTLLSDSWDDAALWSCMTVLFFGGLRAIELVPAVDQYELGYLPPRVCDLTFVKSPDTVAVILKVARTKTKPKGRLLVLGCSGNRVCPYCAVTMYLNMRGVRNTEGDVRPLFVLSDHSVVDKHYVKSRQSRLLAALGINSLGFTTHSYRSGLATTLAMNGHVDLIPKIGDWSSLCYLKYIRTPLASLAANASKFITHDQLFIIHYSFTLDGSIWPSGDHQGHFSV